MPTGQYRALKVFSIVGRHLRSSAPCNWPTRARAAACWCFVSNALHPISTRRLTAACRAQTPADSWGACARSGSRHKPRSRHTLTTRLCTGLELRARWPRGSRSCARSGSSTRTRACTSTSRTSVLSTRHGSQIEHFVTRPCPQCRTHTVSHRLMVVAGRCGFAQRDAQLRGLCDRALVDGALRHQGALAAFFHLHKLGHQRLALRSRSSVSRGVPWARPSAAVRFKPQQWRLYEPAVSPMLCVVRRGVQHRTSQVRFF